MNASSVLDGLEVYLVGGAVRDRLLGYPYSDHDWVVVGSSVDEMLARGFIQVGRDFPVFLHPNSNEEYALARTERKTGRGYNGFEVYASPQVTLTQDLERRDLTINAIAERLDGSLVDPFGGAEDIKARRLRHVGPAFVEDPLRVLRLARFAARYAHLGFCPATSTLTLCQQLAHAGELSELAAERVQQETFKALSEQQPGRYFNVLRDVDGLAPWFLELAEEGCYERCLSSLAQAVAAGIDGNVARWAALVLPLADEQRSALAERLKLPNEARDLARLLALSVACLKSPEWDADRLLEWCNSVDIWRKPERWNTLLPLLKVFTPLLDTHTLGARLERARALTPRKWVEQGIKGKQVGEYLSHARRAVLAGEA
ncbi:polynucleotide adenylyltransferase [Carnimonas bestiolae]|uniref:polynucleotide adenylyltransferase n=1 Tax=Carnimonas bestiolae TaxID=3402172 RepID=UPI003EDCAC2A